MAQDIDRKALKDDVFQDTMFWAVDWVHQRRRWFIAGGVLLLALVAGGVGYRQWHQGQMQAQTVRFYEAEHAASEATLDDAARLETARKAFEAFVKDYPRSQLAPVAWMHIARLAWHEEQRDVARTAFQSALNHREASPAQKDLARIGLAKLAESGGNLDDAAEQFRAVGDVPYKELKALNLGRIALARQQPQEAREQFEQVARSPSGSVLSEWARQNLDYHP